MIRTATTMLLFALTALTSLPAAAQQTLVGVDGTRTVGRLKEITLDGRVVFTAADGKEISRPANDVQALELNEPGRPAPGAAEVWLPAGGTLFGEIVGGAADAVDWKGDLGAFRIPLTALRAVRFTGNVPASGDAARNHAELFDTARADTSRNDDVLFARRGDDLVQLGGYLTGVSADDFTFRYQGNDRKLARSKVYAIVLAGKAAAAVGLAAPARITGVGGSTAAVEVREMRDGKWRLLGPLGIDLSVAADKIARVEFRNNKIIQLAGLPRKDQAVKTAPSLGGAWPVLDDRNYFGEPLRLGGREVRGLCVKALTEIRYELSEYGSDFGLFSTLIGIDDAAAAAGAKVTFEVLADGKSVFKAENVGAVGPGGKPREVNIPLDKVKTLVLRVDYGDGLPVGEVAVWGDARLLRK